MRYARERRNSDLDDEDRQETVRKTGGVANLRCKLVRAKLGYDSRWRTSALFSIPLTAEMISCEETPRWTLTILDFGQKDKKGVAGAQENGPWQNLCVPPLDVLRERCRGQE